MRSLPAPSTQNETIFLLRWNHRYSIINLNGKTMRDYSLWLLSTFTPFLVLPSLYLVSGLWVKDVMWGSNETHSWQWCFLGRSTWKFARGMNQKEYPSRTGGKNAVRCCFIPLQNSKTDIVSGRSYFWVLAVIISCLIISSGFAIFKAEFCHPAGNFNSIRQI